MDETALRALVADWPGTSAETKWVDDLVFMVAGKMFCCLCLHGREAGRLSFKVEDERFLELTGAPGFRPAPYLARAKWVTVDDPSAFGPATLEGFARRAYELVRAKLPKKLQRGLAG